MRRLLNLVILLFTACAVSAQSGDALLKEVADKILQSPSLKAHFIITENGRKTEGEVVMSGNAFMIATSNGSYETWFDGRTMWTWSDMTGEVSMTQPTEEELLEVNPFAVVAQAPGTYRSLISGKNANRTTLQLTPKNTSGAQIKEANLVIDAATKMPVSLDATLKDNHRFNFTFSNIVIGKRLSDKEFRYSPEFHPDAEIIDLR